jgi:type VI secretion system secreted protein VgrG
MSLLDLSFASGENSLSVRRVQVHEGVSTLYNVTVWARSPHSDMDLTALVGQPAGLSAREGARRHP